MALFYFIISNIFYTFASLNIGDYNMYGLSKFNVYGKGINVYHLSLSETKYKREDLMMQMNVFTDFMKRFHVSVEEMCNIIDELAIDDNSLFEYTIINTGFFVAKDYIYTEKQVKVGYTWKMNTCFFDIYLTSNQFVDLYLNKIAKELLLRRFPWLLRAPYTIKAKRFTDSIKKLPKSLKTHLNNIDSMILLENNLTIEDLINIYTKNEYADSWCEKSLVSVYANGSVYLKIDTKKSGHTLSMTFEDLLNKDWKSIMEKHVFSVNLYDENGEIIHKKWYEGKQKDAPYFNNELVDRFKNDLLNK